LREYENAEITTSGDEGEKKIKISERGCASC